MIKINKFKLVLWAVLLFAINARAEINFTNLLKTLTDNQRNIVSEIPGLEHLQAVDSLEKARIIISKKSYLEINSNEKNEKVSKLTKKDVFNLIKKREITFVIVPGVLGEFIDTRAFEEIFARGSHYQEAWAHKSDHSQIKDRRFNLQSNSEEEVALSTVVNAASIDSNNGEIFGATQVKLVILKTAMGSLESVGSDVDKAKIFNRRLQKYFELMRDENIVLLGYSRGTPLALEMLVQAEREGLSYLNNVKALVSYAGVVSGSALADVTDDPQTESGRLFLAAKTLVSELQTADSLMERPYRFAQNSAAVARFAKALAQNSKFDADAFLSNARSGDFKTVAALIAKVSAELGIKSLHDFNGHVNRVKLFITEVLKAVEGLKTSSLEKWWKSNRLPKHIKYLSIAAAMVDPVKNEIEKSIFNSRSGYADTLDDKSLLENKRTYEKLTGVALNDSQVAVHQSIFLTNVIAKNNSENVDMQIKSLGLLETHHWGVSLQTVNKMKDGRLNPFPRERVILALAAYLNQ